jgi:hypothetical protein
MSRTSKAGFVLFCTKCVKILYMHKLSVFCVSPLATFYWCSHRVYPLLFFANHRQPPKVIKPRLLGRNTMQKIVVFVPIKFSFLEFLQFSEYLLSPCPFVYISAAWHHRPMFARANSLGICRSDGSSSGQSRSLRLAQGSSPCTL